MKANQTTESNYPPQPNPYKEPVLPQYQSNMSNQSLRRNQHQNNADCNEHHQNNADCNEQRRMRAGTEDQKKKKKNSQWDTFPLHHKD